MNIILKPAGAVTIAAVVGTLGFFAFRQARHATPGATSATTSGAPVSTATFSEAPLTSAPFAAPDSEGWRLGADGKSLEKTDTNNGECALTGLTLNAESGAVQVKVACSELAPGAVYPKYGLRVKGEAVGDELDVWIDPQAKVLTTRGKVGGTNYDWHASPLPDGFDMTKDHSLTIQWMGAGKEWRFLVDDDRHSAQSKHLYAQMKPASAMVVTYLARPLYRELATR